jgi:hypothetical protein
MSRSSTDSLDSPGLSASLLASSSSVRLDSEVKRRQRYHRPTRERLLLGIPAWMSSKSLDTAEEPLDAQHEGQENVIKGLDEENGTVSPSRSEQALIEAREDLGAGKAEASVKVWGKYSRWVLYVRYDSSRYIFVTLCDLMRGSI